MASERFRWATVKGIGHGLFLSACQPSMFCQKPSFEQSNSLPISPGGNHAARCTYGRQNLISTSLYIPLYLCQSGCSYYVTASTTCNPALHGLLSFPVITHCAGALNLMTFNLQASSHTNCNCLPGRHEGMLDISTASPTQAARSLCSTVTPTPTTSYPRNL